jgi:hypothetical protein
MDMDVVHNLRGFGETNGYNLLYKCNKHSIDYVGENRDEIVVLNFAKGSLYKSSFFSQFFNITEVV